MPTPQFNLRIEPELKEAFLAKARAEGKAGSDLIIGWIKKYMGIDDAQPLPGNAYSIIDERIDERVGALEERLLAELEARLGKRAA